MKTRNGRFHSDFYLSNGERVRKALRAKTRTEAALEERQLQVAEEGRLRGLPVAPLPAPSPSPKRAPSITLRQAFKRARVDREEWRTSKSFRSIEVNYQQVEEALGADRQLSAIDRDVVRGYVRKMQETGLSPSTINQRLSLISVLLKWGEEETGGQIEVLKMPRQKVRKGRIRIVSRKEEATILSWFRKASRPRSRVEDMAELVEFLIDTGFRPSEALRLRSEDVLWDTGMVPAWENKADHPRMVPMTARVRAILASRKALDRPFEMFTVDSADDHWEAMRKGIGVDPKRDPEFVLYSLRHTCASRLAAAGMDAFRIQKWMGHKRVETTLQYVTLFAPDLLELANVLDEGHSNALKEQAKSVPKSVPKEAGMGTPRVGGGPPESGSRKCSRPAIGTGPPVSAPLLIRRSLDRAQVGEPNRKKPRSDAGLFVFTDARLGQHLPGQEGFLHDCDWLYYRTVIASIAVSVPDQCAWIRRRNGACAPNQQALNICGAAAVPSPKPFLTTALFLLSLAPLVAGAEEKKPAIPAWSALAKDEIYEIQVIFLPDVKGEKKTTRQLALNDKDCEQNGNKSLEKEGANSFITVECRADGNLLIRRSTLQPIGKLKQELNLPSVGTSRFEFLQGSDYYPDILIKVSRLKNAAPSAASAAKPSAPPDTKPSGTPGATAAVPPGAKP